MQTPPEGKLGWSRAIRVLLYVLIVASPLLLLSIFHREAEDGLVGRLGRSTPLVAYPILLMQFVVSARWRWAEAPFGLDMVMRFHKAMAVLALTLLLLHPTLLAVAHGSPRLLLSFDLPWYILVAKGSLGLLFLLVLSAILRPVLRLNFEQWRMGHNLGAALVAIGGMAHSWTIAEDVRTQPVGAVWAGLLIVAAIAYVQHRILRPRAAAKRKYRVAEVRRETHNVWTLRLTPPDGTRVRAHLPGQFHFLRLHRQAGGPVEEHPFTIVADPADSTGIASTVKASGDYTATIGDTQEGDEAAVEGPYGRFSYVLQSERTRLVFIAGGVGITPLMSMLRHMRSTGDDREVLLIYANRTRGDIVFFQELAAMAAEGPPRLTVAHVLSEPDQSWIGPTGLVDREQLERLGVGDWLDASFYVCGPPPMSHMVLRALLALGVPTSRLHHEYFAL